jgi:hypothetical protein
VERERRAVAGSATIEGRRSFTTCSDDADNQVKARCCSGEPTDEMQTPMVESLQNLRDGRTKREGIKGTM